MWKRWLVAGLFLVGCGLEEHLDRDKPAKGTHAQALELAVPSNAPPSLKTVAVPRPPNLAELVRDEAAAIRLGKALFWDMQVGSDGKTACATCHFHAGADSRTKNQVNPGSFAADKTFALGPNRRLTLADFPLHQLSNPDDRNSAVLRDTNDVVSSAGVFNGTFLGLLPGGLLGELVLTTPDEDGFRVGLVNTRRVEPRNTPTVINAVFNHRNFWDGRAQNVFNGVNHVGARDTSARVARADDRRATPEFVAIAITNASLASQAVAPIISDFEMAAPGRTTQEVARALARWPREIGRRLEKVRPLAK